MKVSQSMMKAYNDYIQGNECGLVFKAKYIDKRSFPSTDAQKLGQFFEYCATGALPAYDPQVPEAKVVYKGTPKEKLATDYERAYASAEYFKSLVKALNITILDVGVNADTDTMSGTFDVLAEWNMRTCIIDLKYSSLVDDKWNEFGWHKDFLHEKENLLIQGVHYSLLAKHALAIEDVDFYFWVFNAKDPRDVRIFKEEIQEDRFRIHEVAVEQVGKRVEDTQANNAWKVYPSLQRCNDCPLRDECDSVQLIPSIDKIYF